MSVYLDYNATTPTRPEVLEAMLPYFTEKAGNPSSVHGPGRAAREGLDRARRQVAQLLNVHFSQVHFTSGGTEASNLALLGMAAKFDFSGHVITTAMEHPAVGRVVDVLEARGMQVTRLQPDEQGSIHTAQLQAALRRDTRLVSVMAANNETGVMLPVVDMAALCKAQGVLFHTDAVQWVGKYALDMATTPMDLVSLSAHKFGGPKGVGALVMDAALAPQPQLLGGGQERGRRSGTENLTGIVGLGHAAELAMREMVPQAERLQSLRDNMEHMLIEQLPEMVVYGAQAERLANTSLMGFPGIDGETLVMQLDLAGFAVSSGSACSSGRTEPSHVLKAMGVDEDAAKGAIRVTLGAGSQQDEINRFTQMLVRSVSQLKSMAGMLV
ncbi:cysteine desulfurase family protein [Magnetococcus sp. PR-3]|uniref:cysteine desulfurase family protein n=1 Tax=Magnetococcus sp. PR-3 TaxID=3120355 RepID=UPI002FCDF85D